MKTTVEKVIELAATGATIAEIAASTNVSRQRVSQIAKTRGLSVTNHWDRLQATKTPKVARRDGPRESGKSSILGGAKLAPGIVGAAGELIAAVDMIAKGWHVFRAVCPSGPFDLMAYKNGTILKVEVKTVSLDGKRWPSKPGDYDVMALVTPGVGVTYLPSIED